MKRAVSIILESAIEALPNEPASSAASVCRKSSCHPLGELRSSWKSIQVSHLPTALGVNCRFSDDRTVGWIQEFTRRVGSAVHVCAHTGSPGRLHHVGRSPRHPMEPLSVALASGGTSDPAVGVSCASFGSPPCQLPEVAPSAVIDSSNRSGFIPAAQPVQGLRHLVYLVTSTPARRDVLRDGLTISAETPPAPLEITLDAPGGTDRKSVV